MNWTTALVAAGADVAPSLDGTVDVRVGRHRARYRLQRSRRSPRPAEVRPANGPWLLQVPHVSDHVASLLELSGWSYVADDGAALLLFPDGFRWKSTDGEDSGATPSAPALDVKLWARGVSRIVHALLLRAQGESPTQSSLAAMAGVTQAHVSGVVRALWADGLVASVRGRPIVLDRERLIDQWLVRRRFDPVVTYWSGNDDLASALDLVSAHLRSRFVVSGDVAADAIAPHRRPTQLLALTESGSLAGSGLVPVLTPEEANVVLAVTDDPVVLASSQESTWLARPLRIADPLQVLWDLSRATGTDAAQAATQWRADTLRR